MMIMTVLRTQVTLHFQNSVFLPLQFLDDDDDDGDGIEDGDEDDDGDGLENDEDDDDDGAQLSSSKNPIY